MRRKTHAVHLQNAENDKFLKNEETEINIRGRHDPAIIRRICPVIDAVAALAVADLLQQKYGADVMTKGIGK